MIMLKTEYTTISPYLRRYGHGYGYGYGHISSHH